mmetsp:Transcript_15300/g.31264  ORF Transcript_15300/g.31264 Transcript_15300/m.31264 type:complete len:239 (-) Transcript_15300:42-758(-)
MILPPFNRSNHHPFFRHCCHCDHHERSSHPPPLPPQLPPPLQSQPYPLSPKDNPSSSTEGNSNRSSFTIPRPNNHPPPPRQRQRKYSVLREILHGESDVSPSSLAPPKKTEMERPQTKEAALQKRTRRDVASSASKPHPTRPTTARKRVPPTVTPPTKRYPWEITFESTNTPRPPSPRRYRIGMPFPRRRRRWWGFIVRFPGWVAWVAVRWSLLRERQLSSEEMIMHVLLPMDWPHWG